ncbi:hypothetical protein DMI62_02915 [Escherichia coli]|nr:hypothetical protein [Escherichia coli]
MRRIQPHQRSGPRGGQARERFKKRIGNREVRAFREDKRSAPTLPSTVQNSTTIRNPSRDFSSPFSLRFGHQSIEPMARATKGLGKSAARSIPVDECYQPGIIMVPENKITSSPTIRVMARKCISAASLVLQNEVGIILQSLTIAMNHG